MKTLKMTHGDNGIEVIILPSITPNPEQWRLGIRIGGVTAWLRKDHVKEVIKELQALVNER